MKDTTTPPQTGLSFVTTEVTRFDCGTILNTSRDKLAVIGRDLGAWHAFAGRVLDKLRDARGHRAFYRMLPVAESRSIFERLMAAGSMDDVLETVDGFLAAKPGDEPPGGDGSSGGPPQDADPADADKAPATPETDPMPQTSRSSRNAEVDFRGTRRSNATHASTTDRDLANGSMGRYLGGVATEIEGRRHDLDRPGDARRIDPAYALTIHKAQGSQWRRVVVVVHRSGLLDRSMLYTAITRAAEQVVLVGDHHQLAAAVAAETLASRRQTALPHYLDLAGRRS